MAATSQATSPPKKKGKAPTREQPERPGKRREYSQAELDGDRVTQAEKRRKNSVFDVDEAKEPRIVAANEVIKVKRALLQKFSVPSKTLYNGAEFPLTMTFGPQRGFGAGFVDARWALDVFRFGPGSLVWVLVEEAAPAAPKKVNATPARSLASAHALTVLALTVQGERRGRHGEKYVTLARILESYSGQDYSRASSKLLVEWYQNETQNTDYGTFDVTGLHLHTGLRSPHVWSRMVDYLAFVNHDAVVGRALPLRAPALESQIGTEASRASGSRTIRTPPSSPAPSPSTASSRRQASTIGRRTTSRS